MSIDNNRNLTDLLLEIYHKLYTHFGYRQWWPGETPFEIAVGAVLTQNTNWKNVEKAISCLKEKDYLSPLCIYNLSEIELKEVIRSAGFYNQKSQRLKVLTKWWLKRFGYSLTPDFNSFQGKERESVTTLRKELISLKGIGLETADSILLYALNLPTFVIDAYTLRALQRLGIHSGNSYASAKALFEESLPYDVKLFNDYHAQWVALGKHYCRKVPLCSGCPLFIMCSYGKRVG
ncbi:MAG: endonuclease III domain-containing protein [bacterium]